MHTRPIGCAPSVRVSRPEGAAKGRFRTSSSSVTSSKKALVRQGLSRVLAREVAAVSKGFESPPSALSRLHFSTARERLHLRGPKRLVTGAAHPRSRGVAGRREGMDSVVPSNLVVALRCDHAACGWITVTANALSSSASTSWGIALASASSVPRRRIRSSPAARNRIAPATTQTVIGPSA